MEDVRLIAFYLPQFHPIEENDSWWGKGFTEWTNVSSAKPVFPGHYQPHIPADLGFYDLRLAEVREEQARLARSHGIYGFCYYYYYFNGKRLLNRPLDEVLSSGKPDFPFCICWGNENWTRRWDGHNEDILIEQVHSAGDDQEFIRQLLPVLKDKRYIRVNNKLLVLIYRTELLPDPRTTAGIWRELVRNEIGEELYLCAVNNFVKETDPTLIGFDGTVQFPLDLNPDSYIDQKLIATIHGIDYQDIRDNWFVNYPSAANHLIQVRKPDYSFFRGVFSSWDNTPRRQKAGTIFINSSPELYKLVLKATIGLTKAEHSGDERMVFINAWNEWAEGAHLEPDKKYGLRFLEATREALTENNDYKLLMEEINEIDSESRKFYSSTGHITDRIALTEEKLRELMQLIDSHNTQFGVQVSALTQRIEDKDNQLLQYGKLLEQKDQLMLEKERQLNSKESQLQEKNQQIFEQYTQNISIKSRIQVLEHEALQYDREIQKTKASLEAITLQVILKDEVLHSLEVSKTENEELIRIINSLIVDKETEIGEKDKLIQEKDILHSTALQKLQNASYLNQENERIIQNKELYIRSLYNSFSWKITKPLRWIHPRMIAFFYFFCPYGSKRWLILKTICRIILHPGVYIKIINLKTITNYFKILSNANLIAYDQGVANQDVVVKKPTPPAAPPRATGLNPENKLVVPVYSKPTVLFLFAKSYREEMLFDTVDSIIRNTTVPFKIVVCGDSKHQHFDSIQHLDILENHEIPLCLSKFSTIKYLCLLDDSILIQPDTISNCLRTLDGDETFSMVVPGVLNDSGMLESAGSIIWSDGSCKLIGKGEDPNSPEFLYLRETDSGDHFAMVKENIFCQWLRNHPLNFDSWPYALHDLSMFIRTSQTRVIFQPQAQVAGFLSTAELPSESVLLFFNKWKDHLRNDHFPNDNENYFKARERGIGKQYMLMIDHYVPTFDKDAGSRSMKSYMDLFVEHNIILKFMGDNFYPEEKYVTYFQQKGIEILYGGQCEKNWPRWLKENGNIFNYVFISRPTIAIKYIDAIKEFTQAKVLFYGHDLHYLREYRQYQLEQKEELLQYSQKSREMESGLFKVVDVIYYPSQAEIDIIQTEFEIKGKARKIALYIFDAFEKPDYQFNARKDIMFVGGFLHQPNSDAILWFLDEIFPTVCKSVPGIRIFIAGSNPTEVIKSKAADNIIVTGFLSDEELKQLYQKCRIVIAPLRYGAGLKGKIVEALYYGLPVVTTSIGFEGLYGAESVISVENTAEDFAQSIIRLYTDEKELLARSIGSFNFVKENFSKEKAFSIIQPDLDQDQSYFDKRIIPSSKILFVSHDANLGGAQLLLISMLRWFKAHTAIDIRILCNNGGVLLDRFREIADTMVYSDIEHKSKMDQEAAILHFCNGKPDLIYGNSIAAGKSYSVLKGINVPVITHVHELQVSIKHYAAGFIKDVLEATTFYVAGSKAVADNLNKSLGIPENKTVVVHDFIEANALPLISAREKLTLRRELGLVENKVLVFGCGVGLFWRKGIDLFVEIAKHVKNNGPDDFHFYWIGSTVDTDNHPKSGSWETIFKKIKDYGLSQHITFLGIKSNFKEYFKAGDIFLLPSREDPFPLVCLEAAQLGLPVICFDKAGGMPEFVEKDAGFVLPLEDTQSAAAKIRILIKQRDLCVTLGQNARRKVLAKHTVPGNLPKLLSYCRDISGKKPMVSIIVPNYNYGRFLEKRLESILNQTFRDFEIIILDDASDDGSLEIIKRFQAEHPAEIILNTENSGSVFRQWYKGMTIARADIIWIAEADDLSDPYFLEKMLPLMSDKDVNLAYCASHVIDEGEKIIENYYQITGYYNNLPGGNKWSKNYINSADSEVNDGLGIINIIPNASAALIRRTSMASVDTEQLYSYLCAGDWFVYLNIIRSGKIAYNSNPLNYHRRHKQSVVGRSVNAAEETIPDYFKIHKYIIENFHLSDLAFEKQTRYVLDDLRNLWPDIRDEKYFELYDKKELKKRFDNRKSLLTG